MSEILYQLKLLRYKIYKWRLNRKNEKRKKMGQLPIADKYGLPWKPVSLRDLPTPEEIRKNRENIRPLGVIFYFDFKHKNKDVL
jgi:hypothetical protein